MKKNKMGRKAVKLKAEKTIESKEFSEVKEKEANSDQGEIGNSIDKGETLGLPKAHADLEKLKTEEKEVNLQKGKEEERKNNESLELSSTPEMFIASEHENKKIELEIEAATTETSKATL
ncbi:hypothetical protein VNO78_01692 [Psophocarpus tetragonolobus]|uniref:Uncharacterized protein n=1 Tax=Psophocarpus tetragonolobus TaxID=3891 RepID=A0AAN9T0M8_PSOTE